VQRKKTLKNGCGFLYSRKEFVEYGNPTDLKTAFQMKYVGVMSVPSAMCYVVT
jgi:hypothetical protein